MQNKYGKDGVVAMSVSLDDPNEKDNKDKVLKFLESQKATFSNYILDEKPELWQEKLKIDGPPVIYVFDRDNHFVKKLPVISDKESEAEQAEYSIVEKVVAKLLGQ